MSSQSTPLRHASVAFAKPTVHTAHPFKNRENHRRLLEYIQARLRWGRDDRDSRLPRLAQIDRDMAGWMRKTQEDKERQRDKRETGIPQAVQVNLPLAFVHIDDMMTYFAETFAPNRGMFYHTGKPDEQTPANQIVTLMNNHAIYAGYYREILRAIYAILKYNNGGLYPYWSEDFAPKIQNLDGRVDVTDAKIWSGNRLEALDMYNTIWDPSVQPSEVHRSGEFAGRFFMRSHYWLASRAAKGIYYNCDEALRNDNGVSQCVYYRSPPVESRLTTDETGGGQVDWMAILSAAPDYSANSGFELTELLIRINPNDFGLIAGNPKERSQYELWRITVLNDKYIIDTTHLPNAHGQIPFYFGSINDDFMGTVAKAPSEILQPLQDFASVLMNTHILANRKRLWGVTWYDPMVFNFDKIPAGSVAAYAAVESAGWGKNLQEHIWRDNETLETKQTMSDLKDVLDIVNMFFPTQAMPSQIASIDRAVDSQVAAVQQGANRRQHKAARLLDDTLFRPARACMYYNIVQFQEDQQQVTDFTGRTITVNLEELRNTYMPFIIGQGLKAIDRMMVAGHLQSIIFAILQSQQAAQQTDIMAMIDYWTNMIDVDIDFKQFRLQPPQPQGGAQPGAPADQGGAGATPINPITDPNAVTAPLRG